MFNGKCAISAQKTYLSLHHVGCADASCSIQSSLPSHDFKYWFFLPHTSHAPLSPQMLRQKPRAFRLHILQLTHVSRLNSGTRFLARVLRSSFPSPQHLRVAHVATWSMCSLHSTSLPVFLPEPFALDWQSLIQQSVHKKTYLSLQHPGYAYTSCSIQSSLPSHDFKYWFFLPHTSHAPLSPQMLRQKPRAFRLHILQLTHVSRLNSGTRFLARVLRSSFPSPQNHSNTTWGGQGLAFSHQSWLSFSLELQHHRTSHSTRITHALHT